jgi:MoxR-like ATPase
MIGPAGVGKSAIARTCAHKLKMAGNLGASFFFYQPSGWNDPKKFIPTILYQLTT